MAAVPCTCLLAFLFWSLRPGLPISWFSTLFIVLDGEQHCGQSHTAPRLHFFDGELPRVAVWVEARRPEVARLKIVLGAALPRVMVAVRVEPHRPEVALF
jgi:hypothetical protein